MLDSRDKIGEMKAVTYGIDDAWTKKNGLGLVGPLGGVVPKRCCEDTLEVEIVFY